MLNNGREYKIDQIVSNDIFSKEHFFIHEFDNNI